MAILGGGATHAVMGMRVWSDSIGIVASIGGDFPRKSMDELEHYIDTAGLQVHPGPSPRAWQVYEMSGHRTEVFRTSLSDFIQMSPDPEKLPPSYYSARGVHVQCKFPEPLLTWIKVFRDHGCGLILWEPWDIYCTPEYRSEFRSILPLVDIFSPNLEEARSITGKEDAGTILVELLNDGANLVVIRMGEEGSIASGQDGCIVRIPTARTDELVDVTGAGNAFCGGFLVGYATCGDILQAGKYGSVSSSFALEQYGAVYPVTDRQVKARQRLLSL